MRQDYGPTIWDVLHFDVTISAHKKLVIIIRESVNAKRVQINIDEGWRDALSYRENIYRRS